MNANLNLFSLQDALSDYDDNSPLSLAQADYLLKQATLFWLAKAEQHMLKNYPVPELDLSLKGRCAGQAWLEKWKMRFNLQLFQDNRQAFLQEVVPHELAHLIAYREFGRRIKPHGKEWRWLMETVLEVPARTTHRFDVSSSARQNYLYRCGCPERIHPLTIRRHNRIIKGTDYICRDCRQILSFYAYREPETVKK